MSSAADNTLGAPLALSAKHSGQISREYGSLQRCCWAEMGLKAKLRELVKTALSTNLVSIIRTKLKNSALYLYVLQTARLSAVCKTPTQHNRTSARVDIGDEATPEIEGRETEHGRRGARTARMSKGTAQP